MGSKQETKTNSNSNDNDSDEDDSEENHFLGDDDYCDEDLENDEKFKQLDYEE